MGITIIFFFCRILVILSRLTTERKTLYHFKKVVENHFNCLYYLRVEVDINNLKFGGHNLKIEEFRDITIAYMRNIGEYGNKNEKLMEDFKDFLNENNLFTGNTIILGIALDNPTLIPANRLRYDVGFILNSNIRINLPTRKIDDGKYAIFEVIHTKQDVLSFWKNLHNLTADLLVDDKRPIIERYASDKIANHLCEFCVPIL